MKKSVWLLLTLLCLLCVAQAAELTVDPSGAQGQYTTITEALENARDGDTLVLRAGLYAEPAEVFPLKVDKSVTIRAEAAGEAVVEAPMFTTNFEVTAPNVTLENLTINLRRWGVLCLADGLTLRNNRLELVQLARRTSTCGVWLAGVKHAVIEDNAFVQCGLSMAGPPVSEKSVGIPVLTALFEVGEDSEFFTTHTVKGNTVNGKPLYLIVNQEKAVVPKDAGSFIAANCDHVLVDGVDVSYGSMGMIIVGCGQVEIRNSRADFCGLFGAYVAKVHGGGLIDNVTTEGTNHGIDVRGCRNIIVQNCTVTNCDQGIFFSMSDDCVVQDCLVTGGSGGFFFAAGHHNHVINCTVREAQNGVRCEKEIDIYFVNNRSDHCSLAAIRFDRSKGICIGNEFSGDNVGVIAYGGQPLSLYDNRFIGSQSSAVYLNGVGGGMIVGNVFEQMPKAAIQAEKSVGVMLVLDNEIQGQVIDHSEEGLGLTE